MNDNSRGEFLGLAFRFGGIMLFAGGVVGAIFLHPACGLACVAGFAMVMV